MQADFSYPQFVSPVGGTVISFFFLSCLDAIYLLLKIKPKMSSVVFIIFTSVNPSADAIPLPTGQGEVYTLLQESDLALHTQMTTPDSSARTWPALPASFGTGLHVSSRQTEEHNEALESRALLFSSNGHSTTPLCPGGSGHITNRLSSLKNRLTHGPDKYN